MEVILEPIAENHGAPSVAQDAAPEPEAPALARAHSVLPATNELQSSGTECRPEVPVKRPRGRPKGSVSKPKEAPKAKPAAPLVRDTVAPRKASVRARRPPSSSDSSSDSESQAQSAAASPHARRGTSAAVRHLMEDDMETQILQFLTARKQSQQTKRHELWQQLASSGLRR